MTKKLLLTIPLLLGVCGQAADRLRPPAVPLIACDPYFSVWSFADTLTEKNTSHWTGRPHSLTSLVRIDGAAYRLMGAEPADVPALPQKSLAVLPTRTIYTFEGAGVHVTLTFLQPALPSSIDLLSRPVVYVSWDVKARDGKTHQVQLYFDAASELAVNEPAQAVVWDSLPVEGLTVLRVGTEDQPILQRSGDDLRIDWGYLHVAAPTGWNPGCATQAGAASRSSFVSRGTLPRAATKGGPRTVAEGAPALALTYALDPVSSNPVRRYVVLAYDDLYSVRYFHTQLLPYWRRNGTGPEKLLTEAVRDVAAIERRCRTFDETLMADLRNAGGERYAQMASLAYRQCLGANKICADAEGMPLMFSKENFSNGCMGTVDVFYPESPQLLLLNPTLMKATLVPILDYASSERWRFPFAPHDIGCYPHATGQRYGGGERSERNQMPVEECGNMLLLVAAVAQAEGSPEFAGRYWPLLTTWAKYLEEKGLDPENQLCTDDFAGHLAHNVNLSVKAILGLAAYAQMANALGEKTTAARLRSTAEGYVVRWLSMADDGDHYRLAFDKPNTWSQKYNLVWDRVLGLKLFPPAVARKEMAYYRKVQKTYGLPLDSRKDYTKLDWIFWTASITGAREDFVALTDPVYRFLQETPDRIPMTDWYWTHNAKVRGFRARPVVGGLFMRLLDDAAVWRRWVAKADARTGQWAPFPKPPRLITITPTSQQNGVSWRYTFTEPAEGWQGDSFDDAAWKEGPGGFGRPDTPGAVVRTRWTTDHIWIRRSFALDQLPSGKDVRLLIHHDEDAQVYLNGVRILRRTGYTTGYELVPLADSAVLRKGRNTLAVHCRQTTGGQYIDVGIVEIEPAD